ncbi:MAG: hypothetical protein EBR82_49795 [Caulobacteraceae bacterium]|nr:hypothetical protein [Caulobacteraceae bacterium]
MRYLSDIFNFDFDDESGIFWDATVTIDTEYDTIHSYRVGNVHTQNGVVPFAKVDSELQKRIRERMENVETAEFLP